MVEFPRSLGPNDVEALSAEEKAKAFFARTAALSEFADKNVCLVIVGQVGMSQQEEAITGTYYRMCLLLRGLAKLEDPCHFQMAGVDQNRQKLCAKHGWDPKKPPLHWSGKDTLQRVPDADIEYKEIYRSQFFLQSYYVHAGGAGIDSLS